MEKDEHSACIMTKYFVENTYDCKTVSILCGPINQPKIQNGTYLAFAPPSFLFLSIGTTATILCRYEIPPSRPFHYLIDQVDVHLSR